MKQYKVTVNGNVYDVTVESANGFDLVPLARNTTPTERSAAPAAKAAPATSHTAAENGSVTSPMPGTILDVKVAVGQAVSAGDLLFILEAMKMENEIFAPCSGTVSSMSVSNGASVEADDVLCVIA